ncbi:copper-binding protein [Novosphingobium beihaiensis]|uniref:Copper-binding protein n=1 Tax=Novosphingobium beihaiensis TaxID=2930389 RepID=A0ABT0BRI4_9SPHN|nr:copper-binding protein [Novosphingobium beihaiensis]MCJ2187662.1 copper-binding protein [Novosphingobium beihaiensis]
MKPFVVTMLFPALLLAACGQETPKAPASPATMGEMPGHDMAGMGDAMGGSDATMPMSGTEMPGMVSGMGMITAVNPADGTVTIKHGPIPAAHWPAMTMMFHAGPGLLKGMKAGDKVSFDLKLEDDGGTITAMNKQ